MQPPFAPTPMLLCLCMGGKGAIKICWYTTASHSKAVWLVLLYIETLFPWTLLEPMLYDAKNLSQRHPLEISSWEIFIFISFCKHHPRLFSRAQAPRPTFSPIPFHIRRRMTSMMPEPLVQSSSCLEPSRGGGTIRTPFVCVCGGGGGWSGGVARLWEGKCGLISFRLHVRAGTRPIVSGHVSSRTLKIGVRGTFCARLMLF